MAKKSVRTNAFGMTPDSFETTKKRQEAEVSTVGMQPETSPVIPAAPIAAIPVQPVQTTPAAPAQEAPKREYKTIGKDKVRVHFLAKASILERLDNCAEAKDMARTIIIQEALKQYLENEGF